MKSIRVMHLADIHLGIENYGRPDPTTGLHSRLTDFLNSFDQAVEYAIHEGVDLVVFAGDAFKSRDPNPTQQREFAKRLKKLASYNIPVILLVGNHDLPNHDGKAHTLEIYRTLQVEHIYPAKRPDIINITTQNGPIQVACLPYATRSNMLAKENFRNLEIDKLEQVMVERLDFFITQMAQKLNPNFPAVLTAHLSVANAVLSSEKSIMIGNDLVMPVSSLANKEFNYVALGHIHKHQSLEEFPPVVYSGSIDRIDFGEEKEKKGFVIVDICSDRTSYKFVPVDCRPFITVELKLQGDNPTEQILGALKSHDLTKAIVRIVLQTTQETYEKLELQQVMNYLNDHAYLLASIHKEWLQAGPVSRNPQLTEALSPLEALDKYLETRPDLAAKAAAIKEKAAILVKEISTEEGTGL